MGDFSGELIGALLTVLGYDGTEFRNLKTDSDGHVQVDALSSALPSGAATLAKQNTMITALEKIDDLTAALGSIDTDTLVVDVGTSVLPTGAATSAKQDTAITALQLLDDLRAALNDVGTDELRVLAGFYDGDWFALNQNGGGDLIVDVQESILPPDAATETSLQGIEDNVRGNLYNIAAGIRVTTTPETSSGTNTFDMTVVPANVIHHITHISVRNASVLMTRILYGTKVSGLIRRIDTTLAIAQHFPNVLNCDLWLNAGESVNLTLYGCGVSDTLELAYWGHSITV